MGHQRAPLLNTRTFQFDESCLESGTAVLLLKIYFQATFYKSPFLS
jgi:hypothetical protein